MTGDGRSRGFSMLRTTERLCAAPALGMALMESLGIPDMIDEACDWDRSRRNMSPGQLAKAVCGTMFTHNKKRALSNVRDFYETASVDTLFGAEGHDSLNDAAIGRTLDTLYEADTTNLFFDIASRTKAKLSLEPRYMHLDGSNITVSKNPEASEEEKKGSAPVPGFGHPKDGRTDRLQYNFQSMVDEFGMLGYMKAHDGNETDGAMAMDAVKFLAGKIEHRNIVAVADCKLMYSEMVDRLIWENIPFVSKCPENFAERIRDEAVKTAFSKGFTHIGKMGKRSDAPEYEACDMTLDACGDRLRFIVYRTVGGEHAHSYYIKQGGKLMKKHLSQFSRKRFACGEDAERAFQDAFGKVGDLPYTVEHSIAEVQTTTRRPHRGRPSKGETPLGTVTEYMVECSWEFNADAADKLSDERAVRVIVSSVPHSDVRCEDVSEGATTEEVMGMYFGQWRVEHVFGEMKSGIGADEVFLRDGKRESVMLFLIAIAVHVRSIMKFILRRDGGGCVCIPPNVTARRIFEILQNTDLVYDRLNDMIEPDGPDRGGTVLLTAADLLGITPAELLG